MCARVSGTRVMKDIMKDLCSFNKSTSQPMDRLPHDCYMILVGRLRDIKYQRELLAMKKKEKEKESTKEADEIQAEYEVLNSESVEAYLEHIKLEGSTEQLESQRKNHFVYEDNFNSSLTDIVEKGSSFEKLKNICRIYETREGINVKTIMAEHERRVNSSYSYFHEKNMPTDEAKALALAISFYTGTKSEACNRGASLFSRKSNGEVFETDVEQELNEAAIILYYLVKALSYIPFHWGYVTRACELTYDELQIYMPGCLITWIQFSSSKKGKKAVDSAAFVNRNTLFKIFSLTGRPIQQFSNYPEEDEVLFLPHSTFFVFNRKVHYEENKQVIYMRQVELGLCKWSVLWVDDRIFDKNWENKKHMESAAVKSIDRNVHFIPKSSTDSALSFLRSAFGERLKNRETFRIVTDMNRENEKPSHNAGSRLIKAVRQMGFKNKCLIFTSDKKTAEQILQSELSSSEQQDVSVSTATSVLRSFVNFDPNSTYTQHSNVDKSNNYNMPQTSMYFENTQGFNKSTTSNSYPFQGPTYNKPAKLSMATNNQMIHNTINTNIDLLIRNCQMRNLGKTHNNCVLLITGSFNPIHPLHFQNLLHVKRYLENEHQPPWSVLAGYISPTHDSYVRSKLGNSDWIPAKDRCQLCEAAINDESSELSSWISVARGESEWPDGFVDFGPITENFRDFLNDTLVKQRNILKYPLRVVYVCGLDHYNKCSYVENMSTQPNIACAIVYRVGHQEEQINIAAKTKGVIYIPLTTHRNKLVDISSTEIRNYFQNIIIKNTKLPEFIYSKVRTYMVKKYGKQ